MALEQSALLEVLEALKAADVEDRIRQAAETTPSSTSTMCSAVSPSVMIAVPAFTVLGFGPCPPAHHALGQAPFKRALRLRRQHGGFTPASG
jgi:hypothetical protein